MVRTARQDVPTILLIGVGDLTVRLAHILAAAPTEFSLVVASRSIERATRYANLVKLAAFNFGHRRKVDPLALNLQNIDATAHELAKIKPDLIFMGASIQAARTIMDLPLDMFRELDEAQLGPWLPMHVTLNYELMRAVRAGGITSTVVNGAYPDAVGPVLAAVGLAPDIGIGNVGNIVPGITHAAARSIDSDPCDLTVRLVAHHYFSHHVHRFGEADRIPHHLEVIGTGGPAHVTPDALYPMLADIFRRQGGKDGQQLTATSASRVVLGLLGDGMQQAHAPGPGGLPGGYPVLLGGRKIALDLPVGMDVEEAVAINRRCQTFDGIEDILPDATVVFSEPQMAVMKKQLGYSVRSLGIDDMRPAAEELARRYSEYTSRRISVDA
jgi:hypothetical protein